MRTLSIYVKLIIYFLAVALLPTLVLSAVAFRQINQVIKTNSRNVLLTSAAEAADDVGRELRRHVAEVQAWARLPESVESLRGGDRGEANKLFDRLVTTLGSYDLLLLLDRNRNVVAVNSVSSAGAELRDETLFSESWPESDWLRDTWNLPSWSGFLESSALARVLSADQRRPGSFFGQDWQRSTPPRDGVALAAPVLDGLRGTLGWVIAYVDWSKLRTCLDTVPAVLPEGGAGSVYLVDLRSRKVIAERGRPRTERRRASVTGLAERVRQARSGVFEVAEPVRKTIGYATVPMDEYATGPQWVVCAETANDVIYAEVSFLRGVFVLLSLSAVLFVVVVVYFISRRFTKPILSLAEGAAAIADGNLNAKVDVHRVDELGLLANAFNQMANAIRERDEELQSTNLQLKEANRLKSQFLATMSHELRTPMNSIIGFTTLTLQRAGHLLPDMYRENLTKVRRNALHLLSLINSILDLSKIEAGSMELVPEEFSLRALIDYSLVAIGPLVEEKGLVLENGCPEQDVMLYQDRQKVQQILFNLLGNATKFTNEGKIRAGFELAAGPEKGAPTGSGVWVRIWVEDTGTGIAPEDQTRIFGEFVQGNQAVARQEGGTGLGLAISKKLAKLMRGDIQVESEPGRGSVFTVVIPVRFPAAAGSVRPSGDTGAGQPGK